MKQKLSWWLLLFGLHLCSPKAVSAEIGAFSYQGRLADGGQLADGYFDFQFRLRDAVTNGNQVGPTLTKSATFVTNGLFTVRLSFGAEAFGGAPRWLEIGVRTNGTASPYDEMMPSHLLTVTPYALYAGEAISAGMAAGLVPGAIITGDGAGITNLNGANLQPQTVGSDAFDAATRELLFAPGSRFFPQGEYQAISETIGIGNLVKFLAATRAKTKFKLLWMGDSIGADTYRAIERVFSSVAINGIDGSGPFVGFPHQWGFLSGPASEEQGDVWWQSNYLLTNQATLTWAGPAFGGYALADKLQLWYVTGPDRGAFRAEVSTDGSKWTSVGTVDTAGPSALVVTNFALPLDNYMLKITSLGGGSEDRVKLVGSATCLLNSTNMGAWLGNIAAAGRTLDDFMAMGTNSIITLLKNFQPNLLLCQQLKAPETRTNWSAIKALLDTYAPQCDVVLISGHQTRPDPPAALLTNNLADRSVALRNGWAYVDVYTACGSWSNIAAHAWSYDGIHFNDAGQAFEGEQLVRQLNLEALIAANNAVYHRGDGSGLTNIPPSALTGLTTNLTVVSPGSVTNTLIFVNGVLTRVE